MTIDLSALKRNNVSGAAFEKLSKSVQSLNQNYNDDDADWWKPVVDKANNGFAVIRFLPNTDPEKDNHIHFWDHGFKGPGGWYIERSLTSIGKPDPVGESNSELWQDGSDEKKQIARTRKRRLHHVSNIYVVSDPSNPDNEGKVFKYSFGKTIMDKIDDAMFPDEEEMKFDDSIKAVDPYNLWGEGSPPGANFKMKIRDNGSGWRDYGKSEFDVPADLASDEELGKIMEQCFDIHAEMSPAKFKDYATLLRRFNMVTGGNHQAKVDEQEKLMDDSIGQDQDNAPIEDSVPEFDNSTSTKDEPEDLAFFENLAK